LNIIRRFLFKNTTLCLLLLSGARLVFHCAHLSRFHLKTDAESSLRNIVFEIKDRTMDNVQNCDSYRNITWSEILVPSVPVIRFLSNVRPCFVSLLSDAVIFCTYCTCLAITVIRMGISMPSLREVYVSGGRRIRPRLCSFRLRNYVTDFCAVWKCKSALKFSLASLFLVRAGKT
jgi:hypothetical protein